MAELINRPEYLRRLIEHKDIDLVKIVTGIRRCGKSSLLDLFHEHLLSEGVSEDCIVHMNMESLSDQCIGLKTKEGHSPPLVFFVCECSNLSNNVSIECSEKC